jgi:hypothetical protein
MSQSHQFPLYTTLLKNLPDKDLTLIQKNELIQKIEDNQDTHELVYALIKCFYIDNYNGNYFSLPYKASLNKERVSFDLIDLPNKLRQLLFKFFSLHTKKLLEDEENKKKNHN